MSSNWVSILPHAILAAGGFLIFCAGAFWKKRPRELLFAMALIAVIGSGAAAIFYEPASGHFLEMLETEGYGRFFVVLLILITFLSLLFSFQYGKIRGFANDEFFGLLLYAALGMILVVGALHWLVFFLGLEMLSLALYVLIAVRKGDALSNEAGVKYFIMGAVASAFLTFGIAMIYAASGTLNIAQSLTIQTADAPLLLLGLSLVLIGIGFKTSIVPFHLWTPDVYQGAPAPVTAFLATGSKVSLFAALLRFVFYSSQGDAWSHDALILYILAILTMVAGNISAIAQTRMKRLLAYSSVAQMGYLVMTLLAIKENGAPAIMFYLVVYALMDLGAFGTLATLSGKEEDLDALEDYRGLAYSHPWRAVLLSICLGALAGLPPTAGFIGKFVLFRAVLQAKFVVLGVIGILMVMISIYFYFKVIVVMFMHPEEKVIPAPQIDLSALLAGVVVLVLILGLGIFPSPLFGVIARSMMTLTLH
jgi:NADH-quinone oxidoreductase subunit N